MNDDEIIEKAMRESFTDEARSNFIYTGKEKYLYFEKRHLLKIINLTRQEMQEEMEEYRKELIRVCQEKEGKKYELYNFKEEIQKKVFEEIDNEAKRQYEEFEKKTKLHLNHGWEDWKINRERLKQSLQNIFNSNSQVNEVQVVKSKGVNPSDKLADIGDSSQSQNLETREEELGADGNIHGESPDAEEVCANCGEINNPECDFGMCEKFKPKEEVSK